MKHEEAEKQEIHIEDLELKIKEPEFNEEIKEKMLDVARNLGNHGCTKSYIEDLFNPDSAENRNFKANDIDVPRIVCGIDDRDYLSYSNGYHEDFYNMIIDIVLERLNQVNQKLYKDFKQLSDEDRALIYDTCYILGNDWIDRIPLDEWKEAFLCAVVEDE